MFKTKSPLPRKLSWSQLPLIVLLVMLLLTVTSVKSVAQTYTPMRYWSFDNSSNAMKDSSGNFNMDPNFYGSAYTINTNASNTGVGRYMTLNPSSGLIKLGLFAVDTTITVEFLFRPGYQFNNSVFFKRVDGAMDGSMGFPYIYFNTETNNYSGGVTSDVMRVDLTQVGRRSYSYFMDGNWHHMVFRYNTKTGQKQIWVDGECPDGYSKTVTSGYFTNTTAVNRELILNSSSTTSKYSGDYDEMALYNYILPDKQIYKHYLDFTQHKHYTYTASTLTPPAISPVTGPVDVNEFAPGHPSVIASAGDQLNQFPTPRYKPGNTLMKNFNWMDPIYLGGMFEPGVSTAQAVTNSTQIITEAAKNFNYYFSVQLGNTYPAFDTAWIGVANRNPSFKLGVVSLRAQLNSNNPQIQTQSKPNDHYLQNSSGQFIDENGNVTTNKIWRPTAPTSSYTADGNTTLTYFNDLFTRLNRGVDMINENAEAFPYPSEVALAKDPVVTAAKNASGLDWQTFLAKKFKENETQSFRDIFMTHPRLVNAKFTEFDIDGYAGYNFAYSEARKVNSMINNQYYPTPSFYTRFPGNWRNWVSAWHGWQWIVESRVSELALGDRLYSPYVAAGWDANEELNIRPAQWMGLLKALGMTGAEFYYSCFFSLGNPGYSAKNYIWQLVVPSYAQATTSRYEDFLRNGELMVGDVSNNYINPTGPGYSFWAGDLRKLVVVRKHNAANKYAITGTLQPNSNMTGNSENESVAKITLDGQLISFKVRRQGSTYIYDKSNPAAPVFYQLDGWHEATHPSRWTRDFNFEAELFDNANTNAVIKTSVPAGTIAGDFTNHTSYISFNTASDIIFNFDTRTGGASTQYLWVRARSKSGSSAGFTVQLNSGTVNTINCITDTNWVWYRYNTSNAAVVFSGLSNTSNQLKITALNTLIEIDKIAITSNSGALYGNAMNACTGAQATITASGPTSFCQGGSVNLTANSGSSYLWSNGATAQTITVTTSGTYTVTVTTNGVGSATSSPVTITANALPTATISAGSATTFCQGGSVTLTSSAGSSYLWSPGNQTSQSIAVTTSGTYNVRVTSSNGCTKISTNTIVTVNALPTATVTASGPVTFCQGGSVTLTSSTGSSYLWSPGNQTTQSISVTAGGTYSVRVTNSSGCTKVSSNSVVTVNSLPAATISASGPLNLITGGSVTLTANTGSSYLWLPGNQTTQSITVNTAGSYTVRVTNSNGCSLTSAASVVTVGTAGPATISTSGHTSFCQGGSVTLTASSGTSYLWSTGATTKSIVANTSGTYSVIVYNGTSPSTAPGVSVIVWPLPTSVISANRSTSMCMGNVVNLTASPAVSYSWTPGGQTSNLINVSSSGTYNVTVTDVNGCTKTASAVPVTVSSCYACDAPYGLVTNSVTANTATLSWINPNAGQTQFQVKIKNMSTGYVYVSAKVPSTTTSLTVSVSAGNNYRWWVRSWCGTTTYSIYGGYLPLTTPSVRVENSPEVNPFDGTEAFPESGEESDPAMTFNLDENEVQLFPNPASTSASISFKLLQNERMTLSLMELNGKLISKEVIEAVEGFNIHDMNLNNLPKGMYMVQLTGNGKTTTKRLAVQ